MVKGVIRNSNADIGVSITGIAGPTGDTKNKPVGTVCFGYILGYNNSFKVSATKATLLCTTCWRSPSKCFLMVVHSPEIQKPKHTVPTGLFCIPPVGPATTKAILNGDKNRLLDFDAAEHPLVLQLGGSESDEMAQCAKIAQDLILLTKLF
jgi:hypothetical protein